MMLPLNEVEMDMEVTDDRSNDRDVSDDTTDTPVPAPTEIEYITRSRRDLERYMEEKALKRELEGFW